MTSYRHPRLVYTLAFVLSLVLLIALAFGAPARAQAQSPSTLSLPDVAATVGQEVVVVLQYHHEGSTNLLGVDLRIEWNPAVVTLLTAEPGSLMTGWTPQPNINNTAGWVIMPFITGGTGLSQDGEMVVLTFLAGAQAGTTNLTIISELNEGEIPLVVDHGSITLASPSYDVVTVRTQSPSPAKLNQDVYVFPLTIDIDGSGPVQDDLGLHNLEFELDLDPAGCLSLVTSPATRSSTGLDAFAWKVDQITASSPGASQGRVKLMIFPDPEQSIGPLEQLQSASVTFSLAAASGTSSCVTGNKTYSLVPGATSFSCAHSPYPSPPWDPIELECKGVGATYDVDYNETPNLPTLTPSSAVKNVQYTNGALAATDPDGDTASFTLCAPSGDNNNGLFTLTGSVLQSNAPLPAAGALDICVITSDGRGGSRTDTLTLTVVDTNEAPVITGPNSPVLVDENNSAWSIQVAATDDGPLTDYDFATTCGSMVDAPSGVIYSIDSSGKITGSAAFNFESFTSGSNPFNLCVIVRDAQGVESAPFKIAVQIQDVNEAPTVQNVVLSSGANLPENQSWSVQITGDDPEGGTIAYSLRPQEECASSTPALYPGVTINMTGNTIEGSALDYERMNASSFDLCVRLADSGTPPLSLLHKIVVPVKNVLDVSPGDCNFNNKINATDLTATILEYWDDEFNSNWDLAPFNAHRGSPEGCNSNYSVDQNTAITVADVQCTVNLIFGEVCGPDAAGASYAASTNPALGIPLINGDGSIPVTLDAKGHKVAALGFTIKLAPSVGFDPADVNQDGIPDAITFRTPAGLQHWARYNAEKHTVQILIADTALSGASIEGEVATIHVSGNTVVPGAALVTEASAGTPSGADLPLDVLIDGEQQIWGYFFLPSVFTR